MKATLAYRDGFLNIVEEENGPTESTKKWFQVRRAEYAEVQTVLGRPVTSVNLQEGIYVDEEGNPFQLLDKGETKPIEVEHRSCEGENRNRGTTGGSLGRKETARTKRRFEKGATKKSKQRT